MDYKISFACCTLLVKMGKLILYTRVDGHANRCLKEISRWK